MSDRLPSSFPTFENIVSVVFEISITFCFVNKCPDSRKNFFKSEHHEFLFYTTQISIWKTIIQSDSNQDLFHNLNNILKQLGGMR